MYEYYFNVRTVHLVQSIIQNNKANNLLREHLAVHNVFCSVCFITNYKHYDLIILLKCIILMIFVTLAK